MVACKKMTIPLRLIFLIVSVFPLIAQASSQGTLQAGGGFWGGNPENRLDIPTARGVPITSNGFFFVGRGAIRSWLIAEFTLQYGQWSFEKQREDNYFREQVDRFHIPLVFRLNNPWISIGAGFYGSYRIGSVKSNSMDSEGTSAFDYGEHGFEFVFGNTWPIPDTNLHFLLDWRANYSITARGGERDLWNKFLIGITYSVR